MKHRFKRLLAVFLTAVTVVNCIEISEYRVDASAVNWQADTQTDAAGVEDNGTDTDGQIENDVTQDDSGDNNISDSTEADSSNKDAMDEDSTEQDIEKTDPDRTTDPSDDPADEEVADEDASNEKENAEDEVKQQNASQNIPASVEDMEEGRKYFVRTYEDVLALQELSHQSSLEGYVFEFGKLNDSVNTWNFASIKDFSGFGCKKFPFKGTIQEYYETGATFNLNRPLFQYLGSGASLINFKMTLTDATSGIADYLVVTDDASITYSNVTISGTVKNIDQKFNEGSAGALYGTVINKKEYETAYALHVDGTGLDLTEVQVNACVAGGFVGQTKGNISVVVTDVSKLAKAVYNSSSNGIAIGGIIGRLGEGGSFEVASDISISNTVGYNGGTYSTKAEAVGGLIGSCQGATVVSTNKVTKSTDIFTKGGTVGGFIGTAEDSEITISHFTLDGMIKTSIGSTGLKCIQGGVIGSYRTTDQNTESTKTSSLDISYIGINGKQIAGGDDSDVSRTNEVINGGIVGIIEGNTVSIHDLSCMDNEYPYMPALGYDGHDTVAQTTQAGTGDTGGIVGKMTGKNIQLYHLKLSFDKDNNCKLAGKRVGGLIGNVGPQSKILVTDVEIQSLFINVIGGSNTATNIPEYAGGLFGYVDKGSIISLGAKTEVTDSADASVADGENKDSVNAPETGEEAASADEQQTDTEEGAADTLEVTGEDDNSLVSSSVDENDRTWNGIINLFAISYMNGDNTEGGLRASKAKGYIAGGQSESLIYLEGDAVYSKNPYANEKDNSVWKEDYYGYKTDYTLNDIGNYGGLYRNVFDGESYVIDFSRDYGEEVTGTVTYADGAYQLADTADALRLAIAGNTFDAADADYALRFAKACFSSEDTAATGKSLLSANYVVTGNLDLAAAGIFSLVRNDDSTKYPFTGNFEGKSADEKAVINMSIVSTQSNAGLFPYVEGATFKNLTLTGEIYYVTGFGGLAYHAKGNLTIDHVDQEMSMRTRGYVVNNTSINYYGGYVGYYEVGTYTFICKNSVIAPEITNIRVQQVVGGLVGYLNTGKQQPESDNIKISDVTIKSKLTTDSKFKKNTGGYVYQARMSGMIATLSYDPWYYQHDSAGVEEYVQDSTYAKVHLKDITVEGAEIDASSIDENPQNVRATGGFLGYQWYNAEVTVDGTTGVKVTGDSTIKSRGHVGGLFTTFSGKLDFNTNITLDSMEMQDVQGSQKYSAFLVGDGRYAIVTLTDKNYTINSQKVTISRYSNFDEIVGVSCELTNNQVNLNSSGVVGDYKQGGIVNIIMPEFANNMTDTNGYRSYVNRVSTQSNPYTRYYYNLFTDEYKPIEVTSGTATIDSEEDLMLWQLYQYTSGSGQPKLKRFFAPYFTDASGKNVAMSVSGTWEFKGTFDLNGYSFYPARVNGGTYKGDSATIKFYAWHIAAGENVHSTIDCDQRTPQTSNRQQYLMHAGLFTASYGFQVTGITFQGTVANLGADSGALCSKYIGGTVGIKNITLDGVVVDSYKGTCGTGLLLSYVKGESNDGSNLSLEGISTKNYGDDVKAAGALIGQVGSTTATNVRVTMKKMKVEDRKDKVFTFASFICKYYYSSSTSVSGTQTKRIVLYTFTKQDATDGKVTYGAEMAAGVNYYDQDYDEALKVNVANAKTGVYNPYIHHADDNTRYIFVNPRNGNFDEGCGTYEDPYVIKRSGQVKTLFLYLTGSSAYEDIFQLADITDQKNQVDNSWKVNLPGDDGRCDVDGTKQTNHTVVRYRDKNFPGRDVIRTAYYKIANDIDLTYILDMNDLALNCDFSGIGTEEYPFSGVIVGEKQTNGTYPKITLPDSTASMNNYGLIQYMMGGVVKDIQLTQTADTDGKRKATNISNTGNAAGVAAIVLGGDNIIDNVNVDMTFSISKLDNNAFITRTGAYVGVVKRGSVILRNLKAENFSKYSVRINGVTSPETAVDDSFKANSGLYKYSSQLIGWVEDGYVLGYTADKKADNPLIENEQLEITGTNIPLSYSFPIVNGSYIDKGFSKDKITVTGNEKDGFVLTMNNGQQLEMAALALNSDAFSIYDSGVRDVNSANAYDYRAICRKAEYSDVGCGYAKAKDDKLKDFVAATTKDDGQKHYPYVYDDRYMDFSKVTDYTKTLKQDLLSSGATATISYLNWAYDDGNTYAVKGPDQVTTYVLDSSDTKPTDYYLSVYGRSFRGFGALYNKKYSTFKANFNGNKANVIIDMNVDWDSTITQTGMFNGLQTVRKQTNDNGDGGFVIQNLNIKNSHFKNAQSNAVVGALTGYMKGRWTMENVHLVRDKENAEDSKDVYGSSHSGGLIGVINYYSTNSNDRDVQQITFKNCGVTGASGTKALIECAANIGGMVGYVEGYDHNSISTYYGNIVFSNCNVSYTQIRTTNGNAGGYIGRVGYTYQNRQNSGGRSAGTVTISGTKETDEEEDPVAVSNSSIKVDNSTGTYRSAGGLIGVYAGICPNNNVLASGLTASGIVIDNVTVDSNTVDHTDNTYVNSGIGGILGGAWTDYIKVSDIKIKNSQIGARTDKNRLPSGGIVGEAYINDLIAKNVDLSDTTIASYSNGVAGIIASNRVVRTFETENVHLKDSTLWSMTSSVGGVIGLGTLSGVCAPTIASVQIENSKLLAGCTENSDGKKQVTKNAESASAGGVIGYANQNMNSLTVTDVQVGEGTVLTGFCTGGVIGVISGSTSTAINMKGYISIGCKQESADTGNENDDTEDENDDTATGTSVTYKADTNPTILYGKWRNGGVIGSDESSNDNLYSASIRIYNTKIAGYGTTSGSNTAMAAGLAGYESNHNSTYDDVEVKDCMFAVTNADNSLNASAGYLWAYVGGGTHKIYHPILTDNSVGYVQTASQMETLEAFESLKVNELGLVHKGKMNDITKWSDISPALDETNVSYYSYGIGNYLGMRGNGMIYILRPELTFSENFSGNRPVIDVGNNNGNKAADYKTASGKGFPYEYRNYIHIIYFEPKAAAGKYDQANAYLSDDLIRTNGADQEDEYLFSSLDTIAEAYQDAKNTGADFLNDYKLNVTVGGKKVISADPAKDTDSYYDTPDTNSNGKKYIKEFNGVQCLNADGVAAQDLLESMTDILTNTGGADATGILKVTAVSAKITAAGKIEANSGKQSSIEVSGNKVQYRSFAADEPIQNGSGTEYTITLLIYNYGWTGADGVRRSETIYVPVFVVERISVFNDLHILEGEQYSLSKAKDPAKSYQGQVTVAHDSTYTLFSELAYSSARTKNAYQNFKVSKALKLWRQQTDNSWKLDYIPEGLQFTLVDVSTGKPYYYTSTGSEQEIAFTSFKDEEDKPYENKEIGALTTTQKGYTYGGVTQGKDETFGLERFFIYVEPSSSAHIANSIFKWSVSTSDTDASIANFMDESKDYSEIEITWMPGLDISFKEKKSDGTVTRVTADVKEGSAINKDQKVTVTAALNIMADQEYWNQKAAASGRFIDSENNGKYLDVAIYLIDSATKEYVTLPPGTYLRLNGASDGIATTNQSVSYAYQQWGVTFPLSELQKNVQGWDQTVESADGSTYQNTFTLEMDFATADLDEYVGNTYDVYMELRRTSDPSYPLEGTKLDSYSEEVRSYGNKELATTVEVSDIRNLGINTYKEQTNQYEIPFTTKLDFANMIYNEADITTCAKSDYLITYRLKKKVLYGVDADGNPQYKYVAVGSAANPNTISNSKMYANEKLKLALADTADSGVTTGGVLVFRDAYGTDGDREPVYQMIKDFSADEIREGTNKVDYLMQWDMKLTVDTKDIEISDLSNYMVEVTVLPIDPALTESEDTESITIDGNNWYIPKTDKGDGIGSSLKDYFIFTVGKLKTDL